MSIARDVVDAGNLRMSIVASVANVIFQLPDVLQLHSVQFVTVPIISVAIVRKLEAFYKRKSLFASFF